DGRLQCLLSSLGAAVSGAEYRQLALETVIELIQAQEPSRTAASSSASGMPSRRRQRRRTAAVLLASTLKSGTTAPTRSLSSQTASQSSKRSTPTALPSSGRHMGGTSILTSPAIPSA